MVKGLESIEANYFNKKLLYNDSQVNSIVKKEKMRLLKKLGFNSLQDAKKTLNEYENQKNKMTEIERENTENSALLQMYKRKVLKAENEIILLQREKMAVSLGVLPEDIDYALAQTQKILISENFLKLIMGRCISLANNYKEKDDLA